MAAGRPSSYDQLIADEICSQIASTSKSLKTICESEGMPSVSAVYAWLRVNENFQKQYARAKDDQADFMVEEMMEIADDGRNDLMTITRGDESYEVENKEVVNRSRLRVDTRKWIASKLKPKKYGEKVEHSGNINLTNEPVKFE